MGMGSAPASIGIAWAPINAPGELSTGARAVAMVNRIASKAHTLWPWAGFDASLAQGRAGSAWLRKTLRERMDKRGVGHMVYGVGDYAGGSAVCSRADLIVTPSALSAAVLRAYRVEWA